MGAPQFLPSPERLTYSPTVVAVLPRAVAATSHLPYRALYSTLGSAPRQIEPGPPAWTVSGTSPCLNDLPPFTDVAQPIAEAPPLYARLTSKAETTVFEPGAVAI